MPNEKYIYIINLLQKTSNNQVFETLFSACEVAELPNCKVHCKSIMFDQTSAILLNISSMQVNEIFGLMAQFPPAAILLNCSLETPLACIQTVGAALSLFGTFRGMYGCTISFIMQTYDSLSQKDIQYIQNILEMFQIDSADYKRFNFSQNAPETVAELESHIKSALTNPVTKTDNKAKQQLRVDTSMARTQEVRLHNAHKPIVPSPLSIQPASSVNGCPSAPVVKS
jgi:hypothetical protein